MINANPSIARKLITAMFAIAAAIPSYAQTQLVLESASLAEVAINGGTDTINPGVTCVKVTSGLDAICTGGYVALPNNNKLLIAAALQARASGTAVRLYYVNGTASFHCPGLVFTPCSAISVTVK